MNIEQQSHFAAYYNMARRNMFVTLNHIAKLAGLPTEQDNSKESALEEMPVITKLTKGTAEQRERIKVLIEKHMPFIKPVVEEWRKSSKALTADHDKYAHVLTRWCKVLCYYRDKFTHLHFNDPRTYDDEFIEIEKKVVKDLNQLFTASATCIKKRFSLTTELEFLTKCRYSIMDEPYLVDGKEQYNEEKKLITKKVATINTKFFYSLQNDEGRLKENMGVIFFLCQFIEKKYATMLFDRQGYKGYAIYENHNETRRRYIREVFSAFRLDIPRNRMDAQRDEIALAMDMLNELRRCPQELFDIISPENQKKFHVISDTGDDVLLRRSSDRFSTLALQYLDYTHAFRDIRFQVSLGKYRYKFYDKTCVDGVTYVRSLQKELNGFGRINEIDKARAEQWNHLIRKFDDVECDTAHTQPYITDHHAQYVFHAHRVGLYFNDDHHHDLRNGMYLPPIQDNKAPCLQPRCWLSLYDLPALIFHHLLTKKEHPQATENIVKTVCNNYHNFFSAVADGTLIPSGKHNKDFAHIRETYGIDRNDVPRDLQDYFTGKKRPDANRLIHDRLVKMIKDNDMQLKRYREKCADVLNPDMRYGKRNYTTIRPGHLAGLLARDIVLFMPCAEDKPTGKNFSVMQATLATFNHATDKEALRTLLCELNAIGWSGENVWRNHPFLEDVLSKDINNVVTLYEIYWEKRGEYLKILSDNKQFDKVPGYKSSKVRDAHFYRERATSYLSKSFELPRGLFDNAIKDILILHPSMVEDVKKETCNVTYLIARYMKLVHDDDSQQFYSYPRHYSCLKLDTRGDNNRRLKHYTTCEERSSEIRKLRDQISSASLKSQYYDLPQEEKSTTSRKDFEARRKLEINTQLADMNDTERTLRRYRVQDMLMYLAACDIVAGVARTSFGHKLSMIASENDEQFFDFVMPHFVMPITLPDGRICKLTQDGLKLKNYGDFFRFVYDMRVHTLLVNSSQQEIERSLLEAELNAYDGCRPEVFRMLLTIEDKVVNANPHLKGERIDFKTVLNAMSHCSDTEKEIMRLIRNAFSHNYYPTVHNADYDNIPHVAESLKDMLPRIE